MTAAERLLFNRVQHRAAQLRPELAAAVLRAFQNIRDALTDDQIIRLVQIGGVERLWSQIVTQAVLDVAFAPVRERVRRGVIDGVRFASNDLPRKVTREIGIGFDVLNPRMIDAVRELETKVITTLAGDVRETARAYIENSLRDGVPPRTVARSLRGVIGLAPNQELAVRNFRQALEGTGRNPLDYALRDRRFDAAIKAGTMTPERIEKAADAYRKRMIAFNAETNARTAALDAQKAAQRLSWEDAIAKGVVQRGDLRKTWIGVMDARERDEHRAMQGQTVPFDARFSNGEMTPGDSTFNCRCIARVSVA